VGNPISGSYSGLRGVGDPPPPSDVVNLSSNKTLENPSFMDSLYEQVKDMKGGLCTDLETEDEEPECGSTPIKQPEKEEKPKFEETYSSFNGKGKGTEFDQTVDKRLEAIKKPNPVALDQQHQAIEMLKLRNNPDYVVKEREQA